MRLSPGHIHKRQADAIPTADGIGAVQTAAASNADETSALLLGTAAGAPGAAVTAGLIAGSDGLITITTSSSSTSIPTPVITSGPSSSSSGTSTGAIIGIIIGAFAAFGIIVFIIYGALRRRWAKALNKPRAVAGTRGAPGDASRSQAWNKLDDDQDRWEGQEKKAGSVEDANQLSLFRKASSVRTGYGTEEKSTATHQFDQTTMPNFAKYHPDLAVELATAVPPSRPFAEHSVNSNKTNSWENGTESGGSFLSLRMSDSSAVSPGSAKQTPPAISTVLHKWQSAEVLTMDEAEVTEAPTANPFADEVVSPSRSGGSNPFFSAHPSSRNPFADPQSRARNDPVPSIARVGSPDSIETVRAGPARPDSVTRPESSTQALQSLLAVLDTDPEGSSSRPQRASMQPSMASSQYPGTERDSMASFVTYTPKAM